uniref:Vacuolar import/degradation Vid27 C-terminal domain-containing protein n=1 Tax=Chrysotila carterae TaxID=13221 RepID=A0A7S4BL20_CHRCT
MQSPQVLDAGPRGASNLEAMSVLSTGKKGKICFFKGDDAGTSLGSHDVFGLDGKVVKDVGMVQTWNQCEQMLLTSNSNPHSIMLFETETGQTKAELSLRRERRNWDLRVDSITPMQKFEQYKQSQEFQLFGIGDNGKTVFSMNHDSRMGENVEEFVISADSCRKYKSYTFTCHAQTKGGYLVLGRTDGGVALYDAIMKSENASCVIDGYPGPVNSIDVAANGRHESGDATLRLRIAECESTTRRLPEAQIRSTRVSSANKMHA